MKALREIGMWKAVKFGYFTLVMGVYRLLLFPPLRSSFLRFLGARIGGAAIIHSTTFFNCYRRGFAGLSVGKSCFIGDECLIDLAADVRLEEEVTLAERVTLLTHCSVGYRSHPLHTRFPPAEGAVTVHRGSFVGANATILAGVHIGPESFVAAGSVVTEDVPPCTLVAGVPAKPVRSWGENR